MVNQRLAPSSIEARGVVAHYEPGKEALTIWSSTQNPHILRTFVARMLDLGEDRVRAIAPEVGGGFGAKINIYGEEYVAAALSKRLGLPIKWIEDRSEAFLATVHGRDLLAYVELAATREGRVLEQDPDRRVSRRGAARGGLLRRAGDGHAGPRAGDGPGRAAAEELHPARSVPVQDPGGWEHAQVTVERDGRISATTGVSPHGQGNETTFAQMLADQFGVPLDHVTIHHGDTAVVKQGIGTFGSRSQAVGGAALHDAGTKVKAKMARFAAALLEAHERDLVFENGTIAVKGAPASAKPFAEVAAYAYRPIRLPEG